MLPVLHALDDRDLVEAIKHCKLNNLRNSWFL